VIRDKSIEAERQRAINTKEIKDFFNRYKAVVDEHDIQKEDT
jgi:hypothetical protein